jgi:hypothetical protein
VSENDTTPPEPEAEDKDTNSQASANRVSASAGRSLNNKTRYPDAFMDMDSDDTAEEGSYDGHLEDTADSGKNNSSTTSYSLCTNITASACHVSSTLANTAKLALVRLNPKSLSSMMHTKNAALILGQLNTCSRIIKHLFHTSLAIMSMSL